MGIRVALNHITTYTYERAIALGPHLIRLHPAPHSRTPISDYSLRIAPADHYLHWQFDPSGNQLARVLFDRDIDKFEVEVNLVAELQKINPFDFFLEPSASEFPLSYEPTLAEELLPFRLRSETGPRLNEYVGSINVSTEATIDFLVNLNRRLHSDIEYQVRLQPGIQTCEQTLGLARGSCRDSAVLLMQILRHLGLAARFTSGYLIQLKSDEPSMGGLQGPQQDGAELHAWTEVFLPGAGWVGLDPTSGLLATEGHIPLASASHPDLAAPVTGTVEFCDSQFCYAMAVERI